ncbi:MAG: uroporphyrinogen decarboxylase [Alphaproteobacteria bacterium]|nr:uroporphyrinogen decarboxylase [Alphaproteobacteria bacterium]
MTESKASQIKPLLRVFSGEHVETPPVWLMRQAGRYLPEYREIRSKAGGFLRMCYAPEMAEEVTLQPLRRFGMDAAILFSDILVVPDGLGQSVSFREGEGPILEPLTSMEDIKRLRLDRMTPHLRPVYETVHRLQASIPETTTLIGFAGAPWTVATYMIEGAGSKDYPTARRWAFEGALLSALIEILTEATSRHLLSQIDEGAEVVQIFDTWSGVLPEPEFRRWVIAPFAKIVERIRRERPGVPIIGFPRGAGLLYQAFVAETGVDGIGLDPTVPLDWAAKTLQPHCVLQGNLDPMLLVLGGRVMEERIDVILTSLGQGRFIFNLGHGIVPQTPPEHVIALIQRLRAFKRS